MPLYTYRCRNKEAHEVEQQRAVDARRDPTFCERCKVVYGETVEMDLVLSLTAPTFPGASNWRR